jgi:hypothetical protein
MRCWEAKKKSRSYGDLWNCMMQFQWLQSQPNSILMNYLSMHSLLRTQDISHKFSSWYSQKPTATMPVFMIMIIAQLFNDIMHIRPMHVFPSSRDYYIHISTIATTFYKH